MKGQSVFGRVVVGHAASGLQRHARVATEAECPLHHRHVVAGERSVHIADVQGALPGEVGAEFGVNHGGVGIHGRFHVAGGGKFFVLDRYKVCSILRDGPIRGEDHRNRLALPANPVHRERILRRRAQAGEMGQNANVRLYDRNQILAGKNRDDARMGARLRRMQRGDAGVGVGRAQNCGMHHAGQLQVVDESAASFKQSPRVGSRDGLADIAVRAVEDSKGSGHGWIFLSIASQIASITA